MIYNVYTDGAADAKKSTAGIGFVIYTEDSFVYRTQKKFTEKDIAFIETAAIGLACAYMLSKMELTKDDTVRLYTDSKGAYEFCRERIGTSSDGHYNFIVSQAITSAIKLSAQTNLNFYRIKSHLDTTNANKYVDRLAKFALKAPSNFVM